ncbi:hypothetical protein TK35_04075 [Lacticaseibacillus paracasei]|uniref:YopX family protein n=1 Tax=Lacticaseibacillus paracasei TaxID=1597 RepID=UPI0010634578|nr:YopX family protein [Lacticaseibacillus paracasei]TEA91086.1 hypothetical protein TK35_04075 [Lacticaseibacillus paracasei]TEA93443.1 hypothetical protein TK36_04065 [Lacticaseibacillus paracasei]
MKREIKFRVWDHNTDTMMIPDNFEFCDGEICWIDAGREAGPKSGNDGDPGQFEIMQYTGLKDKNGREIYEGDVLDIGLRNQDGKPVIAPVSYETYAAGYVLDNGGNGIWQRLTEDCEVIGNIFENPELLEGKHE